MTEGDDHKYLKRRIAKKYKRENCKTELEHKLPNGKRVDVYAEKNGEKIGIEVGTLNGIDRIEKLKECVDKVVHLPQLGKKNRHPGNGNNASTIWVPSKLKERLDQLKVPSQPYHEIITVLLEEYEN